MTSKVGSRYAISQTALLVLAILGGALVLTGMTAAAAEDLTVTNEGQTVQPGGNLTFEVTDDVNLNNQDIQVWIDVRGDGVYNTSDPNVTLARNQGNTISGTFDNLSLDTGEYTLMAREESNSSFGAGSQPQTKANFTVDAGPPEMVSAVTFTEIDGTQAYGDVGDTVIEVLFNESLSNGTGGTAPQHGDLLVKLDNGTKYKPALNDGGTGDSVRDRRIVLDLGGDISPTAVQSVGVNTRATFTDTAGNRVISNVESARTATTTVAETGDNTSAYEGEEVAIVGDVDDEDLYIRASDGGVIRDDRTGTDSRVFVWSTNARKTDRDYYVMFDGRTHPDFLLGGDVSLTLDDLGLIVTPTTTQYTTDEQLTATVTANAANRTIEATLQANDSTIAAKTITLDETDATVTFGAQSPGEYSIVVEDNKTGLRANSGTIVVIAQTATPSPKPTPAPTMTPSATPTSLPTPTPSPMPFATPTGTTPTGEFVMVGPSTPTPTHTVTATETTSRPTGATPTGTPESAENIIDFLGLMWEGATDAVSAIVDAVTDGVSGLLP